MKLKFFTVATHNTGYFDILIKSMQKFDINLDVLGWGENYNNHMFKTYKTIEYLEKCENDDIVIFIDGFDSILVRDQKVILNNFLKKKVRYLFSNDFRSSIDYNFIIKLLSVNNNLCKYKKKDVVLNTGMFIGFSKDLLKLFIKSLTYLNESNGKSNQAVFQNMCRFVEIPIDYSNDIFYNLDSHVLSNFTDEEYFIKNDKFYVYDKSNNKISCPCIISAPGNMNIDNICLELGYVIEREKSKKRNNFVYVIKQLNLHKNAYIFRLLILVLVIFYLINYTESS